MCTAQVFYIFFLVLVFNICLFIIINVVHSFFLIMMIVLPSCTSLIYELLYMYYLLNEEKKKRIINNGRFSLYSGSSVEVNIYSSVTFSRVLVLLLYVSTVSYRYFLYRY